MPTQPLIATSWARPAVALVLAASLALNVWLALALRDSFVALQLARIFPLGYTSEAQPRGASADPDGVAFYGDSRASAWSEVALGPAPSENRAHGAQTSSQTLLQLQTAPVVRSAVAVVQVGINDLHPLGAMPAQKAEILRRLRAAIPQIRDRLLERSDVVVLTTLFPPGPVPWSRRHAWDADTLRAIEDVNATIRQAAIHDRVELIDAHALLVGNDGYLQGDYRDDFFVHVNRAAYARLNAELASVIAKHRPQGR
jgi:lysophospholipase L1-like esterase